MSKQILDNYNYNKELFEQCEKSMENLLESLLEDNGLKVHKIEKRVKELKSLEKKVNDKKKYNTLDEITDVVGLRIITYFDDDVDKVAELLKSEYEVDWKNSIDKRVKEKPDVFGYSSLHYVLSLNSVRAKMTEYKRFNNIKFEVQIRSILQHAWAEIEHDLGYKSAVEVPIQIRREFSRVSGLLELADAEFIRIKNELSKYEEKVNGQFEKNKLDIPIDKVSIEKYLASSRVVSTIYSDILETGLVTDGEFLESKHIVSDEDLKKLKLFNINTIEELDTLLQQNRVSLLEFFIEWMKTEDPEDLSVSVPVVDKSIVLFYLYYILLVLRKDVDLLEKYVYGLSNFSELGSKSVIESIQRKFSN
ncbi:GTP pyrophosphokinase [Rummeliibacillus sp. BSL5]